MTYNALTRERIYRYRVAHPQKYEEQRKKDQKAYHERHRASRLEKMREYYQNKKRLNV
jgi:hypothetical protein